MVDCNLSARLMPLRVVMRPGSSGRGSRPAAGTIYRIGEGLSRFGCRRLPQWRLHVGYGVSGALSMRRCRRARVMWSGRTDGSGWHPAGAG